MKLKHFLLGAAVSVFSVGQMMAANPNATVDQVRIYINPGHGTYTSGDRPMATIGHGAAGADTAGFYESNTNMQKAYGLLDKLKEYGVPYDNSKRPTYYTDANGNKYWQQNNIRMSHATTGVSPELSTVAEEAQTMNADVFISIHSNANQGDGTNPGGHTNFNQLLFLHRGWDGDPYVSGSDKMARACWDQAIKNKHMHWNWLTDPTLPYDVGSSNWGGATSFPGRKYYPSGKDADGNPFWIKGDVKFQYNTDRGNSSYTRYYGVLNHTIPGFLVEGYDHTYRPAMHRAMNDDVCRHEGELYARGLNDYFGWGKKDSYGKIYGIVRDQSVTMNHTYYSVIQNPTRDANKYIDQVDNKKPLNGVRVALYNSSGVEIDSYTTDGETNGAYFFKKVAPGTYTIKHSLSGYKDVTQEVTVVANETNYIDVDMRTVPDGNPVQGHYAYGLSLAKTDDYTYTASFKSTGAMSDGKIILTNTSTKEQTVILTGAIKKGENSVAIDATKLGDGVNYTWAVAFDNPQSTGYQQIHSDNSITYNNGSADARIGLTIDNDQTSANFGTIYTITTFGQGLQKFKPDFSKDGGKVITNKFGFDNTTSSSNRLYRSTRLTINSGKLYIANFAEANPGVWVYNPSTGANPTQVLTGGDLATEYIRGVDFIGSGSNRVMYTFNELGIKYFNIGTSDSWTATTPTGSITSIGMTNCDGDLFAVNNCLFASQIRYRVNNVSANPCFKVFSPSVTALFSSETLSSTLGGTQRGGMAINSDLTTFAIVDGWEQTSDYKGIEGDIEIDVYNVTWSGNTPSFSHSYTIPLGGTHQVDQMEFDHAGNLYIASQQQGLLVYAIKNPSRQTVTNGSGTITGVKPIIPLYIVGNGEAVGDWDPAKAVEFTDNGNNYTITLDENTTEFKISTGKGSWTEFDAGNLTTNESITNGGTINLIAQHSYNNFVLPWAGVWNITVSGDRSTLTATTNTPKPLPPLYIVGNSESIGNWDSNNAVEFTDNHTEYTITLDENVTAFKISTNKGDLETFNNGNLTPNAAITNGGKVNLIADKDGENIVLPWAGVWNISVASDLSTLTATTSTPRPLYIVGNSEAIGAWNPNNAVEIANNGTNYSITLDEDVTAFKISTGKGDWGVFDAGNLTYDAAITNGSTVNLIAKWGTDFILPWEGVWNITIANDLSKLTASTSTPDPNVGPGIGAEPENAPNPDAETPETPETPDVDEPEGTQTEGYFAYALSSSKSGNNYVFKFKSTGARKNARIILTNTSTKETKEFKTGAIVKDKENTVTINGYDIAKGTYTWAVKINNGQITQSNLIFSDNSIAYHNGSYQCRGGVAIDKDETSANFGTIYASVGSAKGVQRYNPDRSKNGGFILGSNFYSGNIHSPFRLKTNSGKLYITDYYIGHGGVYVYNPSAGEKITNIFTSSNTIPATGIAFTGSGSSRKLYAFDGTAESMGGASDILKVKRYDIGASDSWTAASASAQFDAVSALLTNGNVEIIPSEKGLFVSQTRYSEGNVKGTPSITHITPDGTITFNSGSDLSSLKGNNGGAMALYNNKVFATVNGAGNIEIYHIAFSGNTPQFTYQYTITTNSATTEINQMDFDHAGNLYAFSRHEALLAYSVKMDAHETVTNAMASYTIEGMANPAPTNVVATRKCNGEGNNTTAGTVDAEITWSGDAGKYRIYYQTMRRDDNGNRVEDNSTWQLAGEATIASGTTGKYTHKNLAHGGDYARIYNYKVVNYYSDANYEGLSKSISGKGRTVTSYPSQLPINVVLAQPTEEKDGMTLYSLDLKLDVALNKDVFKTTLLDDNDEPVKATKYVIVTDEATAKKLNAASNVKEVGRFYRGTATMTANNCNHYDINDWYMVVDFEDVTPADDLSKATKTLVWKDVELDHTYKPQVYTSAVRTFNFTSSNPESVACKIEVPSIQWTANSNDGSGVGNVAEAIPVKGDVIESLAGNEDYPMGTFQKIGDLENPTNPIEMTKANMIGATGHIDPLPVTDDVLNEWDITYTLILKDKDGKVVTEAVQESNATNKELYSNTQKRIVDILGLNVGRNETTTPDGRVRYEYNAEKNDAYTLVVRTTYRKTINGEPVEKIFENEAPIIVNPSFPDPVIDPYKTPGYVFLETGTHWDVNCKDENGEYINDGYFKYYYDVVMDVTWEPFNDNMVRYMGYYGKGKDCIGHPVESNIWTPYQSASILTDLEVLYYNKRATNDFKVEKTLFNGIGYTKGATNWSTLLAEEGHIPVKVHYAWAGNEKLTEVTNAAVTWELSANYPVVICDEPMIKVSTTANDDIHDISAPQTRSRSAVGGKDLVVIATTNQKEYTSMVMDDIVENNDITTGVEDVSNGEGGLRLYPNPASSMVTLQAPVTMSDVKIFSIDGQLVKEFDVNDTKARLNVSDLTNGVYIVHAAGTSTRLIKK